MPVVIVVLLSYQTGCCYQTDQFQIAWPQRAVDWLLRNNSNRSTMIALKSDWCFVSCTIEFFVVTDLKHSLGYSYHVTLGRNCF